MLSLLITLFQAVLGIVVGIIGYLFARSHFMGQQPLVPGPEVKPVPNEMYPYAEIKTTTYTRDPTVVQKGIRPPANVKPVIVPAKRLDVEIDSSRRTTDPQINTSYLTF